ncbi:hypothetical protein D3C76_1575890 [compost metagenome]
MSGLLLHTGPERFVLEPASLLFQKTIVPGNPVQQVSVPVSASSRSPPAPAIFSARRYVLLPDPAVIPGHCFCFFPYSKSTCTVPFPPVHDGQAPSDSEPSPDHSGSICLPDSQPVPAAGHRHW